VQQHAAIGFDSELVIALGVYVGDRLDPQVRRIRMRADDSEARLGGGSAAHLEGRERPTAAHDVVPRTGGQRPGIGLVETREARLFEAIDGACDRVIGRGRTIDEGEQVVDGIFHGSGA
jgi:hypothetical protein